MSHSLWQSELGVGLHCKGGKDEELEALHGEAEGDQRGGDPEEVDGPVEGQPVKLGVRQGERDGALEAAEDVQQAP
eukprot:scaffold657121_cov71-Prasinocladus_malaysianus.AAC.1